MTDFGRRIPVGAILGDGIEGRVFRIAFLAIRNGTNADTLKCTLNTIWNGDNIAQTDNVAKDATTGHFTLDAAGNILRVENAGLTGIVLAAFGTIAKNASGTALGATIDATGNDIYFLPRDAATGDVQDLTALVDVGIITIYLFYITDQ